MHRRRAEFLLDALEVIEPLDRAIESGAFLLGELGFHLGNRVGELRVIEFLDRGGDIGEPRTALLRHFGATAAQNELLMRAAHGHREDSRPDRGDDRRMAGEHAEIALDAGDVNLIDFAGEGEFFRGDEIEMEGSHGRSVFPMSAAGSTRGSINQKTASGWIAGSIESLAPLVEGCCLHSSVWRPLRRSPLGFSVAASHSLPSGTWATK